MQQADRDRLKRKADATVRGHKQFAEAADRVITAETQSLVDVVELVRPVLPYLSSRVEAGPGRGIVFPKDLLLDENGRWWDLTVDPADLLEAADVVEDCMVDDIANVLERLLDAQLSGNLGLRTKQNEARLAKLRAIQVLLGEGCAT